MQFTWNKSYFYKKWILTFVLLQLVDWAILQFRKPIHAFEIFPYFLSLTLSLLGAYLFYVFYLILPKYLQHVFAVVAALLIALTIAANFVLYKEFGEYLTGYYLTIVWNDPKYFLLSIRANLVNFNLAYFLSFVGLFFFVWYPKREQNPVNRKKLAVVFIALILPFFVILNQVRVFGIDKKISMDSATVLAFKNLYSFLYAPHELGAALRNPLQKTEKAKINVLLILNESWGKKGLSFYSSPDTAMPFLQKWIQKEIGNFIVFPNAFTNSSATDVSVPSIMTGVLPYESAVKLHQMPFLWDWAKSSGLKTVFITSQRYKWANFNQFFFTIGPDAHFTADETDVKYAGDMGNDDILSATYLCNALDKFPKDTCFFAVFNTNALHNPFQQSSEYLPTQPHFESKYENSQFIVDAAIEKIAAYLEATHRLENTLIIFTGDHCETDLLVHKMPRLYNYYDEITNIPFLVRVPPHWQKDFPDLLRQLSSNTTKNVQNADIAPTIADILGANSSSENKKVFDLLPGNSLFREIPANRPIIALNTNDVRHWNNEGFGIYIGSRHFAYSEEEKEHFYDVATDKFQQNNLWNSIQQSQKDSIIALIRITPHLQRIYK